MTPQIVVTAPSTNYSYSRVCYVARCYEGRGLCFLLKFFGKMRHASAHLLKYSSSIKYRRHIPNIIILPIHCNIPLISNTMASIRSYFSGSSMTPDSDKIILAPSSINPRRYNVADGTLIEPDEFKLNGKQYVRCCVLAKPQKNHRKRTSVVWMYGEDIQLKQDPIKRFWYCYLCEHQHRQQELPISGKGNTTALDHLESKHEIDRKSGEFKPTKKDPSQTSIIDFNK